MRRLLLTSSVMLLAGMTVTAHAADSKSRYAVRGFGAETCKQILDPKEKDRMTGDQAYSWIQGYLTGLNLAVKDTYDILPIQEPNALLAILVNYCQKNPNLFAENAFAAVVAALAPMRVREESPLIDVKVGDRTVPVRAATLIQMHARLIQLGLYKGKAEDGFGPKTEEALKAFQKSQNVAESGVPDADTVIRLLVTSQPRPAAAAPGARPQPAGRKK